MVKELVLDPIKKAGREGEIKEISRFGGRLTISERALHRYVGSLCSGDNPMLEPAE